MPDNDNAGLQDQPTRRIMRALKINEISGVDVPAQEGAVAVIMKRKGEPGYKPDAKDPAKRGSFTPQTDETEIEKGAALTTAVDGHTHLLSLLGHDGGELSSGTTSWVDEHAHPWIRNESGEIVIGEAHATDGMSHDHQVGELSKLAEEEAAGETGKLGTQEDTVMTTEKTQEQIDAEASVVTLTAQLDRANQIAGLNDAEKAHFAGLEDAGKDEFLAKSADERKALIEDVAKAATDADPIAYTTLDGVVLHKSAGEGFIAMAKSNDELRKRVEKAEAKAETASYEKRVEAEVPHLPGDMATRVALLKAVDGIENDEQRAASLGALKAQSVSLSKSFETFGHGSTPAPGSPDDSLDKLAQAYQASHPEVTIEKAYDVVSQTPEGAELYSKLSVQ